MQEEQPSNYEGDKAKFNDFARLDRRPLGELVRSAEGNVAKVTHVPSWLMQKGGETGSRAT